MENAAREHLRKARTTSRTPRPSCGTSTREIAELEAAKKAEVVHVRWDRSLRDHKESLDSYHPDGWVWDRVYPDFHSPGRPGLPPWEPRPGLIRITMVPGGNRLPTATPFEPVDLDAVSGVLRAPLIAEQPLLAVRPSAELRGGPDPPAAEPPRSGVPGPVDRARGRASSRCAASRRRVDVGVAPATADVQVVMGQPNSIIVQDAGDSVWLRPVGTEPRRPAAGHVADPLARPPVLERRPDRPARRGLPAHP